MLKLKKIKLNRKKLIYSTLILLLIYHLLFSMVWFRIPVEDWDVGCGILVSEICIFNPFRDRTLERKFQKMIDFLKEQDKTKASRIFEELKQDKKISRKILTFLSRYKKREKNFVLYFGKISPVDYYEKDGVIYFAFYIMCNEKLDYCKTIKDRIIEAGFAKIDPKTKRILEFHL